MELAASAAFHVEHRSCSENTHALRGTCQEAINYQQPRVNRRLQYIKTILTAFPSKHHADSHKMDLLRTAPSPLKASAQKQQCQPPFGSQFWLPIWGHVFMNSICFFLVCVFEPPIWGQVLGPVLGAKIGPQMELAAWQLSTSSIVLAVKTHTHCVVRAKKPSISNSRE